MNALGGTLWYALGSALIIAKAWLFPGRLDQSLETNLAEFIRLDHLLCFEKLLLLLNLKHLVNVLALKLGNLPDGIFGDTLDVLLRDHNSIVMLGTTLSLELGRHSCLNHDQW